MELTIDEIRDLANGIQLSPTLAAMDKDEIIRQLAERVLKLED